MYVDNGIYVKRIILIGLEIMVIICVWIIVFEIIVGLIMFSSELIIKYKNIVMYYLVEY